MRMTAFLCFFALAVCNVFGKEIPNTIGAVKSAKPGDYIVLIDGSHYVLEPVEIKIVNDEFNYNEVEALKENDVPRSDGGSEFNITRSHKRIIWPDGKSMDVLLTSRAFDAYIKFLGNQYDPIPFTIYGKFIGNTHSTKVPEGMVTFRGKVYKTFLTDGVETFDYFEVEEFNRPTRGDGLERGFQVKGGTIVYTLSGGGNLTESGIRREE